jgi:hypothetical protein
MLFAFEKATKSLGFILGFKIFAYSVVWVFSFEGTISSSPIASCQSAF